MSTLLNYPFLAIGIACGIIGMASPCLAQMANNPWGFTPQNRASVAALIRQVENENRVIGLQQGSPSNLVCGSDGKSSASGNTTCVILNNSTGQIEIGQESEGDQTATSTTTTQTHASDDVLETLNGTANQ